MKTPKSAAPIQDGGIGEGKGASPKIQPPGDPSPPVGQHKTGRPKRGQRHDSGDLERILYRNPNRQHKEQTQQDQAGDEQENDQAKEPIHTPLPPPIPQIFAPSSGYTAQSQPHSREISTGEIRRRAPSFRTCNTSKVYGSNTTTSFTPWDR